MKKWIGSVSSVVSGTLLMLAVTGVVGELAAQDVRPVPMSRQTVRALKNQCATDLLMRHNLEHGRSLEFIQGEDGAIRFSNGDILDVSVTPDVGENPESDVEEKQLLFNMAYDGCLPSAPHSPMSVDIIALDGSLLGSYQQEATSLVIVPFGDEWVLWGPNFISLPPDALCEDQLQYLTALSAGQVEVMLACDVHEPVLLELAAVVRVDDLFQGQNEWQDWGQEEGHVRLYFNRPGRMNDALSLQGFCPGSEWGMNGGVDSLDVDLELIIPNVLGMPGMVMASVPAKGCYGVRIDSRYRSSSGALGDVGHGGTLFWDGQLIELNDAVEEVWFCDGVESAIERPAASGGNWMREVQIEVSSNNVNMQYELQDMNGHPVFIDAIGGAGESINGGFEARLHHVELSGSGYLFVVPEVEVADTQDVKLTIRVDGQELHAFQGSPQELNAMPLSIDLNVDGGAPQDWLPPAEYGLRVGQNPVPGGDLVLFNLGGEDNVPTVHNYLVFQGEGFGLLEWWDGQLGALPLEGDEDHRPEVEVCVGNTCHSYSFAGADRNGGALTEAEGDDWIMYVQPRNSMGQTEPFNGGVLGEDFPGGIGGGAKVTVKGVKLDRPNGYVGLPPLTLEGCHHWVLTGPDFDPVDSSPSLVYGRLGGQGGQAEFEAQGAFEPVPPGTVCFDAYCADQKACNYGAWDAECDFTCQCQNPDACNFGEAALSTFQLDLTLDNYPGEVTWSIVSPSGQVVAEGGPYSEPGVLVVEVGALTESGEHAFEINDEYGDGICCAWGSGGYVLSVDGVDVASGGDYGAGESKPFDVDVTVNPCRFADDLGFVQTADGHVGIGLVGMGDAAQPASLDGEMAADRARRQVPGSHGQCEVPYFNGRHFGTKRIGDWCWFTADLTEEDGEALTIPVSDPEGDASGDEAVDDRCPSGWMLPNQQAWGALEEAIGGAPAFQAEVLSSTSAAEGLGLTEGIYFGVSSTESSGLGSRELNNGVWRELVAADFLEFLVSSNGEDEPLPGRVRCTRPLKFKGAQWAYPEAHVFESDLTSPDESYIWNQNGSFPAEVRSRLEYDFTLFQMDMRIREKSEGSSSIAHAWGETLEVPCHKLVGGVNAEVGFFEEGRLVLLKEIALKHRLLGGEEPDFVSQEFTFGQTGTSGAGEIWLAPEDLFGPSPSTGCQEYNFTVRRVGETAEQDSVLVTCQDEGIWNAQGELQVALDIIQRPAAEGALQDPVIIPWSPRIREIRKAQLSLDTLAINMGLNPLLEVTTSNSVPANGWSLQDQNLNDLDILGLGSTCWSNFAPVYEVRLPDEQWGESVTVDCDDLEDSPDTGAMEPRTGTKDVELRIGQVYANSNVAQNWSDPIPVSLEVTSDQFAFHESVLYVTEMAVGEEVRGAMVLPLGEDGLISNAPQPAPGLWVETGCPNPVNLDAVEVDALWRRYPELTGAVPAGELFDRHQIDNHIAFDVMDYGDEIYRFKKEQDDWILGSTVNLSVKIAMEGMRQVTGNGVVAVGDTAITEVPIRFEWSCGNPLRFWDVDYNTTPYQGNCWMTENLATQRYRDGRRVSTYRHLDGGANAGGGEGNHLFNRNEDQFALPHHRPLDDNGEYGNWQAMKAMANDGETGDVDQLRVEPESDDDDTWGLNLPRFRPGYFYSAWAVQARNGICPTGWRLPDDEEWEALEDGEHKMNKHKMPASQNYEDSDERRAVVFAKWRQHGSHSPLGSDDPDTTGLNFLPMGLLDDNGDVPRLGETAVFHSGNYRWAEDDGRDDSDPAGDHPDYPTVWGGHFVPWDASSGLPWYSDEVFHPTVEWSDFGPNQGANIQVAIDQYDSSLLRVAPTRFEVPSDWTNSIPQDPHFCEGNESDCYYLGQNWIIGGNEWIESNLFRVEWDDDDYHWWRSVHNADRESGNVRCLMPLD